MLFGSVNMSQIYGPLHEFSLVDNKWWALDFKEFSYKDTIFDFDKENASIAVVDTGTSMISIPLEDYNQLVKMWEDEISNSEDFVCQLGLCIGGQ